jgi:hypothetical protein
VSSANAGGGASGRKYFICSLLDIRRHNIELEHII